MSPEVEKSAPIATSSIYCAITGKKAKCDLVKANKETITVDSISSIVTNKDHATTISFKTGIYWEQFDKPRPCTIKQVVGSVSKSIDCDM